MKKIRKFKLLGLLIFLSVALVFIGINHLEAKKPPKWEWKVGIPTSEVAEGLNVYGNSFPIDDDGYAVFEENEFIQMGVQRCEDSDTGEIFYHVYFRIYNNPDNYSIGFQNLDFKGCKTGCSNCWCCVFPPATLPAETACEDLNCYGEGYTDYECMQNFLQNYDHPSVGYEVIAIRMYIFCDIEAIPQGHSVTTDGQMWSFDIWNTSAPLINGNEEYHNIVCKYLHYLYGEGVNNLEDVQIQRSFDGNNWTVIVNQDGSDSSIPGLDRKLLAFRESYEKAVMEPIGKSGKFNISSEGCTALAARTVFKFESKWTRFKK